MSTILVTGAAGFIGAELVIALLASDPAIKLIATDTTSPPVPAGSESRVQAFAADLTDPATHANLLSQPLTAAYLLHGIMSGGAEADLELGLRVNLDSHRSLLDAIRTRQPGLTVIFPSSIAAFGPTGSTRVTESTNPIPQSSYGTQKVMMELLVNDYSRRGLIDGRIARLPTVVVRPGAPSAAASSFASGIVREPLKGERSVLPVRPDLLLWVCSPDVVVRNLVYARSVPGKDFGISRVVNLPGQTVSVQALLDALEAVGGKGARALVDQKRDPVIEDIVESWPTFFDTKKAKWLGFEEDLPLEENIANFAARMQQSTRK